MKPMPPKDVALFLIPFVTAPISLLSSSYVVYLIYKKAKTGERSKRNRRSKPREHILLGMSLMDIIFSFGLSFSTLPGPAIYKTRLPTAGTVQTCTAQGFFVQFGLGAPLYNACLCVYFLLRVRYKVTDEYLMKWAIPVMHLIILSFSFGTAISGIVLKLFNYAGVMGCWIHPVENLCDDFPEYCDRGQRANDFVMYFGLIHVALCFLFVLVSMIILSCHVYRTESKSRQWEIATVSDNISIDSSSRIKKKKTTTSISDASITTTTTRRRKKASTTTSTSTQQPKTNLTQKTIKTGILYSASFLIVWLPSIILGSVPKEIGKSRFYASIQILAVVLQPFQGLMNMMIYTSPDWLPKFRILFCNCLCCWYGPNDGFHGGDEEEGNVSLSTRGGVSRNNINSTRAAAAAASGDGRSCNGDSSTAAIRNIPEDGTQSFAAVMSNCSSSKFDDDDDDDDSEEENSILEEMKRKLEEHRNNKQKDIHQNRTTCKSPPDSRSSGKAKGHIELTMGCPPNISGFTCSEEDDDEEEWDEEDHEVYENNDILNIVFDNNNNEQEEKHEITANDSPPPPPPPPLPSTTQTISSSQFHESMLQGDLTTTINTMLEEEISNNHSSTPSIKMFDFSGRISNVDLSDDDDNNGPKRRVEDDVAEQDNTVPVVVG